MMSLYMPRPCICICGKATKTAVLAKNTVDLIILWKTYMYNHKSLLYVSISLQKREYRNNFRNKSVVRV